MNVSTMTALLLALASVAASAQTKPAASEPAPEVKAGLWEITIVEQGPNTTNKRTTTSRTCFAADDLKTLDRLVPKQLNFGMKCENRDVKAQGATVTWRVACTGTDGSTSGTATMTVAADSYTAQAKLDAKSKRAADKLEQAITGKWVGDCK